MITRIEHPLVVLRKMDDEIRAVLQKENAPSDGEPTEWAGILCRAGENRFLIDSNGIREIASLKKIGKLSTIPHAKPWLKGLGQLRGNLLPIVDLGLFLTGRATTLHEKTRVVIGKPPLQCGLIVDEIGTLKRFQREYRTEQVGSLSQSFQKYCAGSIRLKDTEIPIVSLTVVAGDEDIKNLIQS